MNKQEILDELQNVLESEFDIGRDKVTPEALLYEDLDLDSIDAVDLMAFIVKLTGKRMSPEEFSSVRTVGDVLDVLARDLS